MSDALRKYWHPVAAVEDLDGGPIKTTLLDEDLVVFRSGGEVHALQDLCIHRGTPLSLGSLNADGCLVCAYHGWTYDTSGRCVYIPSQPPDKQRIPSQAKVPAYRTAEHYGLVYVALDEPVAPVPEFPEYYDDAFHMIRPGEWTWNASAARFVENAIDIAHLPIVHPGLLADADATVIAPFEMEETDRGYAYSARRHDVDEAMFGDADELVTQKTWVEIPFSWRLLITAGSQSTVVFIANQPISLKKVRFWEFVGIKGRRDQTDDEVVAFHQKVIEQDRHIVEHQKPEMLPLDITAELHLRVADEPALEYRRRLADVAGAEYA